MEEDACSGDIWPQHLLTVWSFGFEKPQAHMRQTFC